MSNPAVRTEIYKGYKIEIFTDEDASNPQEEFDQAGKMICWHRRYNLGNKHDFKTPRDFMESLIHKDNMPVDLDEVSDSDVELLARLTNVIFPLHLYDHSGISISMRSFVGRAQHAEWDSGQVGWIYISHADVIKEWGDANMEYSLQKAEKCLAAETETYNDYLTGNVYGYVVSKNVSPADTDEDDIEWEETDSCWGYYGDHTNYGRGSEESYVMQEAQSIVDHNEEKDLPLLAGAGLLKENGATG